LSPRPLREPVLLCVLKSANPYPFSMSMSKAGIYLSRFSDRSPDASSDLPPSVLLPRKSLVSVLAAYEDHFPSMTRIARLSLQTNPISLVHIRAFPSLAFFEMSVFPSPLPTLCPPFNFGVSTGPTISFLKSLQIHFSFFSTYGLASKTRT